MILGHELNIQVVLRKNAEFYRNVFDNIDPDFYYHYLWKSSPVYNSETFSIHKIFNQLFLTARAADAKTHLFYTSRTLSRPDK